MLRAEEVTSIYHRLLANGIQVWLTGGWGIDALLEEETRPHKDLDVIMLVDDVAPMRELLGRDGYGLGYLLPIAARQCTIEALMTMVGGKTECRAVGYGSLCPRRSLTHHASPIRTGKAESIC